MTDQPTCSVIVPVFNERDCLPAFFDRLISVTEREPIRWEFVFVDDGSTDDTFSILQGLHAADHRVSVLRLSRNFGSHSAIAAGLQAASGDAAVIMGADLQDPPEVIHKFLQRWREGYEVVWGVRTSRQDTAYRRIGARAFYWLIRRIALPSYPAQGTGSFCLIDRQVIDTFKACPERNRVTFGLIVWVGFRQVEVEYDRPRRHAGESKWCSGRLAKNAIDTILGFSYAPVRGISFLGIMISLVSFAGILVVVGKWLLLGSQTPGWASLMVCMLFLGGLQLLVLGVLGEYMWRILEEARGRPLYIVKERLGRCGHEVEVKTARRSEVQIPRGHALEPVDSAIPG